MTAFEASGGWHWQEGRSFFFFIIFRCISHLSCNANVAQSLIFSSTKWYWESDFHRVSSIDWLQQNNITEWNKQSNINSILPCSACDCQCCVFVWVCVFMFVCLFICVCFCLFSFRYLDFNFSFSFPVCLLTCLLVCFFMFFGSHDVPLSCFYPLHFTGVSSKYIKNFL